MIQLIILLGIISIIDFSTKKIPVVVLVVMGIVGIASSFYDRLWRCSCCDAYGIVCDC